MVVLSIIFSLNQMETYTNLYPNLQSFPPLLPPDAFEQQLIQIDDVLGFCRDIKKLLDPSGSNQPLLLNSSQINWNATASSAPPEDSKPNDNKPTIIERTTIIRETPNVMGYFAPITPYPTTTIINNHIGPEESRNGKKRKESKNTEDNKKKKEEEKKKKEEEEKKKSASDVPVIDSLEKQIKVAVDSGDYEQAAVLKKKITSIKEQIATVEKEIKTAVDSEDYENAAKLKKKLVQINYKNICRPHR